MKSVRSVKLVLLFSFLFLADKSEAQLYMQKNSGISAGIVLAAGSHFDRIGISVNAYYVKDFIQVNSDVRFYFNFRSLGPPKKYAETVLSAGIVFGFGKTSADTNLFLSSVSNQMRYRNSFAYSYNCYFNRKRTSQQTGIFGMQFDRLTFLMENDIFAHPRFDRFRTGAFLLQYQYKQFQYGINSTLWTGQMGERITDSTYELPNGYMDTTGGIYPTSSHGLLSAQVKSLLPYSQYVQANAGIDAEQVRNAIQNRLIHHIFSNKNAPIPMIDQSGGQYLYREGQKIKPVRPYWNVFLDPSVFY
ncbi:MAG TPA: polymorphic toxin type 23 domain-containing protein [Bacteroidia bacterium]|jgi:hypothetical protein|nr:polymorphic toxin type 23 domain-containing protein [Bacteroidia bacterium]